MKSPATIVHSANTVASQGGALDAAPALTPRALRDREPARLAAAAPSPAAFRSILFEGRDAGKDGESLTEPEFFHDLNLDQIVDAVTAGRQDYNLKPFFYCRLTDLTAVAYRHEVFRDLENEALFQSIQAFSSRMRRMREHLAAVNNRRYHYEKEGWFLDAAAIYCEAVEALRQDLDRCVPDSRGLRAFRTHLAAYAGSARFTTLRQETQRLKAELSAIRYGLLINGNSVTVRHYNSEADYSETVRETFARFRPGAVKGGAVEEASAAEMNAVEAMVLERVAQLNPRVFLALDDYCARNKDYPDPTITVFDREVQFYVAWLEYAETFKRAGFRFCYPQVSDSCKNVSSRDGFDLALAGKLIAQDKTVVCNDFTLSGPERIFVVTGPNQGGKTTFARTFGQLHYLASLGCPVPGTDARLFLFDRLFAHFEREEDVTTLRGKLEDDLVRIHRILEQATPNSVIVINEIFSATSVKDAAYLSRKIIERVSELDLLCVCVSFLDELASANEKTVSMVATVAPDNPTQRTYKIERRPPDGLAYALAIAEKYRVTYAHLRERLKP